MKMNITEAAEKRLLEKMVGTKGYLKLIYDIEGCGCGVNGVPTLWLEKEIGENERALKTENIPIYVRNSQELFFEEEMTIDYSERAGCFQLKSPNEYLNPRMSFIDRSSK